jgi:hypothetical protein
LIEARNEGETMLRATEKSLGDERAAELSPEERRAIDGAVAKLRAAMAGTDYKQIRERIDELNQATMRLAELMMNRILETTLEGKRLDEV